MIEVTNTDLQELSDLRDRMVKDSEAWLLLNKVHNVLVEVHLRQGQIEALEQLVTPFITEVAGQVVRDYVGGKDDD